MKNLKKGALFLAVLTAAIMIMPSAAVYATNGTPDVTTEPAVTTAEPEKPAGQPVFSVEANQTFSAEAGKETYMPIKICNIANDRANFVFTTVTDESNHFEFVGTNVFRTDHVSRNCDFTVPVKFKLSDKVPSGVYPLNLSISYTNYDGATYSEKLTVHVTVKSNFQSNSVDITNYSVDKTDIKDGDNFLLTVTVKNNSGAAIERTTLKLSGVDGTKFAMNGELPYQIFDIKNKETKTFKFNLVGCAGIASIREVIGLNLSYYTNPSDTKTLVESKTEAAISTKKTKTAEEQKTLAPQLIIDSYNFGGDYVSGGKTFPLSMKIKNTSDTTSVKNLIVTVSGAAGSGENGVAYSPANSTNSFFFKNITAGASEDIKLDMRVRADAKPDSYPINVDFSYEFVNAAGITEKADALKQTISIPLQQEDRFTLNTPEYNETPYVGEEFRVSCSMLNKGKSSVYNVEVDVQGTGFEKTSSKYYVGNIDSGKEEYYDTTLTLSQPGHIQGFIVVTYEDANGNQKEARQEFVAEAQQMVFDDTMIDMPVEEPQAGMPWWVVLIIIVVGIAVVITAIVVTVKLVKRAKMKKLQKMDEDDD